MRKNNTKSIYSASVHSINQRWYILVYRKSIPLHSREGYTIQGKYGCHKFFSITKLEYRFRRSSSYITYLYFVLCTTSPYLGTKCDVYSEYKQDIKTFFRRYIHGFEGNGGVQSNGTKDQRYDDLKGSKYMYYV